MNISKIVVHLSIPLPAIYDFADEPVFLEDFYSALKEIIAASGSIKFPLSDLGNFYPNFICTNDVMQLKDIEESFPSVALKDCEHLFITVEVPYEEEKNIDAFLSQMILKNIYDFYMVVNLCHPGLFDLKTCEIIQNGVMVDDYALPKMDGLSIQFALLFTIKQKWPYLHRIKLVDAWNWLLKRKNFLEMEGFDNDPVSRAMNAFSRLFEDPGRDFTMHLVWAMVGIEALFVRQDEQVKHQVREGVSAILGSHPIFKQEFNKMYGFRSRFIHGGVDIPGLYYLGDARPELERYDKDQERTISFAVAILIASLQQIISGNGKIPTSL